jgi:hypothetical protein
MLDRLSWFWIVVMAAGPSVVAPILATIAWRRQEFILGNVAGTVVIFGTAIGLILRESMVLDRLARQCIDAGIVCAPQPEAFTRYTIYAAIGLVQVVLLFLASLRVERSLRERQYSSEWRR